MFFPSPTKIITRNILQNNWEKSEITHPKSTYKIPSNEDRISMFYSRPMLSHSDEVDITLLGSKPSTEFKTIIKIVRGEKLEFGVRQFLSNHGSTTHLVRFNKGVLVDKHVDFDVLQGKYLLICCVNVPMLNISAEKCRAIIEAYDELSQSGFPFELVVVANMTKDVQYSRLSAFYHFYSAFSCLAIPFSDFKTRDYIYSCIVDCFKPYPSPAIAIFVDPEGIVLQTRRAFDIFFYYYSPDCVPFLDSALNAIQLRDVQLRSMLDPMNETQDWVGPLFRDESQIGRVTCSSSYSTPATNHDQELLSLSKDILLCDPNLTLRRFHPETEVTTVRDLSDKYVGLYLCINGSIMELIKKAYDNCLAKRQQLEIVLVCMPFYDEPHSYNKCLDEAVQGFNVSSWFRFDYNSKVCRRLWRIFGNGYFRAGEKLIIIPPNCESGELCGREVIANFGINEYPFTRTAILRRRLEYVRSLTPLFPSLFNNCHLIQNRQDFKSEQLQGKNVLLYLSWCERDLDSLLMRNYPDIKAKGWEVVFVPLAYTDRYWNGQMVDRVIWDVPCLDLEEMPWPFMPPSAAAQASIKEKLFFLEDSRTSYLFAVGKDGSIVSRDVEYQLDTDGVTESLFTDVLERDLASGLADMPLFEN